MPCNSGLIELAKGADFTSGKLLVISKITPDLLILVSNSLARIPTIGFLYSTISRSVWLRSAKEEEEDRDGDKVRDAIRVTGTRIANIATIAAEDTTSSC